MWNWKFRIKLYSWQPRKSFQLSYYEPAEKQHNEGNLANFMDTLKKTNKVILMHQLKKNTEQTEET